MPDATSLAGMIGMWLGCLCALLALLWPPPKAWRRKEKWHFKARKTSALRAVEEGQAKSLEELAPPSRADNLAAAQLHRDAAAALDREATALDEEAAASNKLRAALEADTASREEEFARRNNEAARRLPAPAPSSPAPSSPAPSSPASSPPALEIIKKSTT
ncbi:MAG: hypothetical protein M1829_001415 [Trizodia sp. TS-e1964]|nr:MAG: hypothetical protein M1829_001415 [Trizodia sp. TS-e1964]